MSDAIQPHVLSEEMPDSADEGFESGNVLTIAGAHFVHDSYSAFVAPLLPLLQDRLGLTYALSGSLAIYTQLPSLLNPFIGYLADRISLRYFVILAPGVTGTLMSMLGLANSYVMLAILLFAAGLSIAAFHAPAPAMIATMSGRRVGKGMSYFMAAGELGRAVGPLVVVAGISLFTLEGMWRLAFFGWGISAILWWRLHDVSAENGGKVSGDVSLFWGRAKRVFPPLIWLMATRVFMIAALTTYLPTFMSNVSQTDFGTAALSLTFLEAAGVAGALLSGSFSDRWGRTRMLALLLFISPLVMLLFLWVPTTWMQFVLLIALGLTAISPQPVLLALIQDQFPDNRALANGTFIAVNFMIRALGIWFVGYVADVAGLDSAFFWSAIVGFLALPGVFWLERRTRLQATAA
jgi:FSR family fosmidomycin resistance protein-like MFS transporter